MKTRKYTSLGWKFLLRESWHLTSRRFLIPRRGRSSTVTFSGFRRVRILRNSGPIRNGIRVRYLTQSPMNGFPQTTTLLVTTHLEVFFYFRDPKLPVVLRLSRIRITSTGTTELPPNKALQLTDHSTFQSIHGTIWQ